MASAQGPRARRSTSVHPRWALRTWRLVAGAVLVALAILTSGTNARANGRYPHTNWLAVREGAPDDLLLRSTVGFLVSKDRGATWDWICEAAVGFGGQQDPMVLAFPGGTTVAAHTAGIAVTRDAGCSWTLVGGDAERRVAIDIAFRAGRRGEAVAVVSRALDAMVDDGGNASPRYETWILATTDSGLAWSRIGAALDPTFVVQTIETSPSNPRRIVITANRYGPSGPRAFLLVSEDGAKTFRVKPVEPWVEGERGAYVAAVLPARSGVPERIVLRTDGVERGRILVTSDSGATFREVWTGSAPKGFAATEDGRTVWVGSRDGLEVADGDTWTFERRAGLEVQCLTATQGKLYACSNEKSGFLVGVSEDDGRSFAPLLHWKDLRGPLACPADSGVGACVAGWPKVRAELPLATSDALGGRAGDGGSGDGAVGAGLALLPDAGTIAAREASGSGAEIEPASGPSARAKRITSILRALVGGTLIGLAASLLLGTHGRIAGISGILAGLVPKKGEPFGFRVAFTAGLVAVGIVLARVLPDSFGSATSPPSGPVGVGLLAVSGLLVGFGTRLGGGCTSGHGVCGISRGSFRSVVATVVFMVFGMIAVFAMRRWGGVS
ncbi:MAG: YeeE/YedE family protein [Polyangiaceae bacterium]